MGINRITADTSEKYTVTLTQEELAEIKQARDSEFYKRPVCLFAVMAVLIAALAFSPARDLLGVALFFLCAAAVGFVAAIRKRRSSWRKFCDTVLSSSYNYEFGERVRAEFSRSSGVCWTVCCDYENITGVREYKSICTFEVEGVIFFLRKGELAQDSAVYSLHSR